MEAAPPATPLDLNALLDGERTKHNLPAVAAAVIEDGKIVAQGAVGRRRADREIPVTLNDVWHIGSCTKSMTAVLIGALVDAGKLRWDMTVGEALPGVSMHEGWKSVTVQHLLNQQGGVPGATPGQWSALARLKGTPREQRAAFAAALVQTAPVSEPGKVFAYSNAGYGLLGAIAEQASGQSYEELLQTMIFAPLSLKTGGLGPPATLGGWDPDQPWGHRRAGDTLTPVTPRPESNFPPALAPAANVHLSLADFARYASWVGRNEPPLLSAETFHHLQVPPKGSHYACGQWETSVPGIGPVMAHTGHMGGFFGVFYSGPKRAVVVVFNTEGGGWEWLGDEIAAMVSKAAFKEEPSPQANRTSR